MPFDALSATVAPGAHRSSRTSSRLSRNSGMISTPRALAIGNERLGRIDLGGYRGHQIAAPAQGRLCH